MTLSVLKGLVAGKDMAKSPSTSTKKQKDSSQDGIMMINKVKERGASLV